MEILDIDLNQTWENTLKNNSRFQVIKIFETVSQHASQKQWNVSVQFGNLSVTQVSGCFRRLRCG